MAIDLTGGLDDAREYVFTEPPAEDGMREAVNMWIWDDAGGFSLPRFAIEAVAPEWETHEVYLNASFPDRRLLRQFENAPAHPVRGADGKATKFGAGPLAFECVEPFRRYRTTYDGSALDTTFEQQATNTAGTQQAALRFVLDCETVVPPWVQGTMSRDAAKMLSGDNVENAFMGGDRLEQLCRVTGEVTVDGETRRFTGGGLRIRRRGVRQISGFWGHCWQSAVFPSGKAFGVNSYPPRPDGTESYNEGYVFHGDGALVPARVVKAPWLRDIRFSGEDVSLAVETDDGIIEIAGESVMGMPSIGRPGLDFPPLVQSIVRYRWDGEEAYGMMERSNLPQNVSFPGGR